VLLDPRCAVLGASVHPLPGSDHLAVSAEFRLPRLTRLLPGELREPVAAPRLTRWAARRASIPADRPAMVISDGLFAFLCEQVIVGVFRRVTEHFKSNLNYGRIGWFSRVAVKLAPQQMFSSVGSQRGYAGFKGARVPEFVESAVDAGRGGQPDVRSRG
jgi:hypothetical protein